MKIHTTGSANYIRYSALNESIAIASAVREDRASGLWDRLGVGISGICVLHCLLLPVLLVTAPLLPVLNTLHAWVHPVFAVLLVPTTAAAAWYGWRQHRRNGPLGLLGGGLLLALAAGVLGHEAPGAAVETLLTVTGSGMLIAGHWRNWRLAHSASHHLGTETPLPGAGLLKSEEVCND